MKAICSHVRHSGSVAMRCCALGGALLLSVLSSGATAEFISVNHGDNGWTYIWDPNTELPGESHPVTSLGANIFSGTDVQTIIGADRFYTAGIDGSGTVAANIEAGHIWDGHEALTHASTRNNDVTAPGAPFVTPAYDRHATWTGMLIGGRRTAIGGASHQEGIAEMTDLRSGAIATGWVANIPAPERYALGFSASATSLDFPYSTGATAFGTADVINSSWGSTGVGAGSLERQGMDIRSLITDSLANGSPHTTFVASAGNSGTTIGTNSVGAPGAGYNNITVGALANDGADVYDSVAAFSSRGPQDYGDPVNMLVADTVAMRAAVDIAAPGDTLTSAYYGGETGGNDPAVGGLANGPAGGPTFYSGFIAGTSFAAPITAGGVALMHNGATTMGLPADSHDTRVIKANLLNAADKIPGWDNGQSPHGNGNGGVTTSQSLDFASGAGALDLDRTFDQFLLGQSDIAGTSGGSTSETVGWDFAEVSVTGSTDVVITTPMAGGSEFRATLSWFRERSYGGPMSVTDSGFANLNLEVWDSTFTNLISESMSTYNPVEHLTFALPSTGTYGLRVTYPSNVFGALTDEEFGLAWWGVAIPEPGSIVLLLAGVGLMGARRERRRFA